MSVAKRLEEADHFNQRRYTISMIAELEAQAGGFYFSRGALRFFGQTRRSFKVIHADGRVFVEALRHDRALSTGISFSEFNPITCRMVVVSEGDKEKYGTLRIEKGA